MTKHACNQSDADAMRERRRKRYAENRKSRKKSLETAKKTSAEMVVYNAQAIAEEIRENDDRRGGGLGPTYPDLDRLHRATLALPPCGCTVIGRGTLAFPIRIKFCKGHGGL